ncbi:hypothetical protein ABG067_000350 [Albugo candida]
MFIEIKEHDKIMKEEVKDMNLRPRVLTAFDMILQMNQLEIAELSWAIQDRLGISDDAFVMGNGDSEMQSDAPTEEEEEEKTSFDVKLASFDPKSKIKVIKEIRTLTGLGLKEAKELVEGAPSVVKKNVTKEEAESILSKLKECGAVAAME